MPKLQQPIDNKWFRDLLNSGALDRSEAREIMKLTQSQMSKILSDERTVQLPEFNRLNDYLNKLNGKLPTSGHNSVAYSLLGAASGDAPAQTDGGVMQEHILRQLDELAKRVMRLENRIFDAPTPDQSPEGHTGPQKGGKARV